MKNLKKYYVLLVILIVIYAGINFSYNGTETINNLSHLDLSSGLNIFTGNDNSITVGSSSFDKLDNFTSKRVYDHEVRLYDTKKNITIHVFEIRDIENISKNVNNLILKNENITSNQTISQNNFTVYFLYEEHEDTYNIRIYFAKKDKKYLIKSNDIKYEDSDYLINSCKNIINSMQPGLSINYSRY